MDTTSLQNFSRVWLLSLVCIYLIGCGNQATLKSAPAITAQPAAATVTSGQSASFTVNATGEPAPTYQWFRAGTAIAGATSATYTFATTPADNGATFSATATNSVSTAQSTSAALTVNYAPQITTQPASFSISAGIAASFTVTATGNPTPTYQWYRNGTAISGATGATYTLPAAAGSDNAATFYAIASNSIGTATSATVTLSINGVPQITQQPVSITVTSAQTATFTVAASGNPTLTYQWYKNGAPISGAIAATYTTPATALTDSGSKFNVVVTNSLNTATSTTVTLSVNARPPSNCAYAKPVIVKPGNQDTGVDTLSCTGGDVPTKFSISTSPALPLTFDAATGNISGSLTTYTPLTTYTVTASNSGGSASVPVQIAAVTATTLTSGHPVWGADGHFDKGGIYGLEASADCSVPGLLPDTTGHCTHSQVGDLETIFGTKPNSIFYRAIDDVTGCNDWYYNHVYANRPAVCDPTVYNYKQPIDQLQQTGVVMPIAGLILYPFINSAGCTLGSLDISQNVPTASFSETDMYNWGYCTAARAITYVPENMYWYIGNEWDGQIPLYPNDESTQYPTDPSIPASWKAFGNYPYYRGALAGAIAAIRALAPYATIISGAEGSSIGLTTALGQDLANYKLINPKGQNLIWDVTNLHWVNDVESVATAQANGVYYGSVGLAFPDDASFPGHPGLNAYQSLNTVGANPAGIVPPIFVDEMGSGDGNDHASSLEPQTGAYTTAQMLNLVAHSPASTTEPGTVGGNFYQLYPACTTAAGCPVTHDANGNPSSPDTTRFLFCYGNVCNDGNSGRLSYAGAAVQAWITQHGTPSTNSGAQFTLTPTQATVVTTTSQPISNLINITTNPGSAFTGTVALTCTVFKTPYVDATVTPTCTVNNPTATPGSSVTVTITPNSSTASGTYTVFVTADYGGTTPSATNTYFSLQIN